MNIRTLLLPVLFVSLLSACVTSQGTMFRSVRESADNATVSTAEADRDSAGKTADSDISPAADTTPKTGKNGINIIQTASPGSTLAQSSGGNPSEGEQDPAVLTSLEIHTQPQGATVYLNYAPAGTTPLAIQDIRPGTYQLSVHKDGYYSEERTISVREGTRTAVSIELRLITGYLSLRVEPADAEISIGSTGVRRGVTELPIGTHELRIRRFGYEEKRVSVRIRERRTTELEVTLDRASMRVSELFLSRRRINPDNPGPLGQLTVRFEVTGPGTGTLEVLDESGTPVYTRNLPVFRDWSQLEDWDGIADSGVPVRDGEYTIRVTALGENRSEYSVSSTRVSVDRSLVIGFRNSFAGAQGLLFAPVPDTLPAGSFQISAGAMGHQDPADGYLRVPTHALFRLGLTDRFELDLSGLLVFSGDGTEGTTGTAVLTYRLAETGGMRLAAALRGTVSSFTSLDTFANFPGVAVSLPLQLQAGPVRFVLAPELLVSPFRVSYEEAPPAPSGLSVWGYAKAGLYLDYGSFVAGLSAAFRSGPFSEGFGLELPVQAGLELHWMIPGTSLYLSGEVAGEFAGTDEFYLMAGGGLGFIH